MAPGHGAHREELLEELAELRRRMARLEAALEEEGGAGSDAVHVLQGECRLGGMWEARRLTLTGARLRVRPPCERLNPM